MPLEITGLERIELMELREAVGAVTEVPTQAADTTKYGDFGLTAAVVILGTASISAIAWFLAKTRTLDQETSEARIETKPDGTSVINLKHTSRRATSAAPDAAAVSAWTNILEKILSGAARG